MIIRCDEMWSYVEKKSNKEWIWLAKDRATGEIAGVYIGSRGREGAKGQWDSLPGVCRQCAVCHTDFWSSAKKFFHPEDIVPLAKKQDRQAIWKDIITR